MTPAPDAEQTGNVLSAFLRRRRVEAAHHEASDNQEVQVTESEPQPNTAQQNSPAAQQPKAPPPPINWETELSTRSQQTTLGQAARDVVRKVIHGDNADG